MTKIDKRSRVPLYAQLMDAIIEKIENKTLLTGAQLMSEREMCAYYDVSRSTVRQAIQALEREGYIESVHGKGTFVSDHKMTQNLSTFYSFTEEMKHQGKVPSSRVLQYHIIQADKHLSSKIGVSEKAPVIRFERLRLANGEPMMLETTYLPEVYFKSLTQEALETQPLYTLLESTYGLVLTHAEESFSPVLTDERESALLGTDTGTPSLRISRWAYAGTLLVEYTESITRGDCIKYRVVLKK
ncbi:GntR family transcriptional regulator [Fusibacter sp. JL298sf-3]